MRYLEREQYQLGSASPPYFRNALCFPSTQTLTQFPLCPHQLPKMLTLTCLPMSSFPFFHDFPILGMIMSTLYLENSYLTKKMDLS